MEGVVEAGDVLGQRCRRAAHPVMTEEHGLGGMGILNEVRPFGGVVGDIGAGLSRTQIGLPIGGGRPIPPFDADLVATELIFAEESKMPVGELQLFALE